MGTLSLARERGVNLDGMEYLASLVRCSATNIVNIIGIKVIHFLILAGSDLIRPYLSEALDLDLR